MAKVNQFTEFWWNNSGKGKLIMEYWWNNTGKGKTNYGILVE
jgi:hypothetical protein